VAVQDRRGWRQLVPGTGPLATVPPIAVFAVVAVVFAAGVLVGGVIGALLLFGLAVLVAALLAATWRQLRPADRVLRLFVPLALIAVAVSVLR
jgi:hypothetical protein